MLLLKLLKYWPRSLGAVVCTSSTIILTAAGIASSAATPLVLKKVVDMVHEDYSNEEDFFLGLDVYSIIFVYAFLWTLSQCFTHVRAVTLKPTLFQMGENLSIAALKHMHELSLASHTDLETSSLTNLISSAQFKIGDLACDVITNIIPTLFEISLASGVIIYLYGYPFGLSFSAIMGTHLGYTITISNWAAAAGHEAHQENEKSVTRITESLTNFELVQLFNNLNYELSESKKLQVPSRSALVKVLNRDAILKIGQNLIVGTGLLILTLLSGKEIIDHNTKLGLDDFVLINAYLLQFIFPLTKLGALIATYKNNSIPIVRLLRILELPIQDISNNNIISVLEGGIVFDSVYFKYRKSDSTDIVRNISFVIKPKSLTAIIGRSGGGKSTLLKLLTRFYSPDKGNILIDGFKIENYSIKSLRTYIAVVSQEIELFNATLKYNICYGNNNASDNQINIAIKLSGLQEVVTRYGLEYKLNSRANLSGGEKKRICIARALLKSPAAKIFVFDEPTSSLDNITSKEIGRTLLELSKSVTVVIITHQLELSKQAHHTIVVENGMIISQGTHANLLSESEVYKTFFNQENISSDDHSSHNFQVNSCIASDYCSLLVNDSVEADEIDEDDTVSLISDKPITIKSKISNIYYSFFSARKKTMESPSINLATNRYR